MKPGARLPSEAQIDLTLPAQSGFGRDARCEFDEAGPPLGDVAAEGRGVAPFEAMTRRVVMHPVHLRLAAEGPARGQFHSHRHDESTLGMAIVDMGGR